MSMPTCPKCGGSFTMDPSDVMHVVCSNCGSKVDVRDLDNISADKSAATSQPQAKPKPKQAPASAPKPAKQPPATPPTDATQASQPAAAQPQQARKRRRKAPQTNTGGHPSYAAAAAASPQASQQGQAPAPKQKNAPQQAPRQMSQQPTQMPKPPKAVAVIALVLSLIALLSSPIPIVNFLSATIALVALVAGVFNIVQHSKGLAGGKKMSIAAVILSILAIAFTVAISCLLSSAIQGIVSTLQEGVSFSIASGEEESGEITMLTPEESEAEGEEEAEEIEADTIFTPARTPMSCPYEQDSEAYESYLIITRDIGGNDIAKNDKFAAVKPSKESWWQIVDSDGNVTLTNSEYAVSSYREDSSVKIVKIAETSKIVSENLPGWYKFDGGSGGMFYTLPTKRSVDSVLKKAGLDPYELSGTVAGNQQQAANANVSNASSASTTAPANSNAATSASATQSQSQSYNSQASQYDELERNAKDDTDYSIPAPRS